ncbi:serine/threonine-protein kinase [Streptomyces niveus]|uniref:serine/threonine-protein kinase n=1 Tax=Streptomyces niveus TaxID=193462 RepID=UPI00341F3CD0
MTIFDLGQDPDDGTLYLVMEFVTGRGLDAVLREDGTAQIRIAVDWIAQTAAALQAAHTAGVVHRDLKPANLMATPDNQIKILDFGIARYIAATHKSSKVIGTLAYMPPERFGDHPADPRSDLNSLGCVLHELLTGSTPFRPGKQSR